MIVDLGVAAPARMAVAVQLNGTATVSVMDPKVARIELAGCVREMHRDFATRSLTRSRKESKRCFQRTPRIREVREGEGEADRAGPKTPSHPG